jgi:thioredoxin-like negative regulator of GroEL
MGYVTALVVLQAAVAASPASYQTALAEAQEKQQPLVVLIGAEWCPGCRTMKHSVLPQMSRSGALSSVSFATVDTDRDLDLARQLMRGSSIPQLIAFSRTADGQWHREQIIGATSPAAVAALVERARKNQQPISSTPAAVAADD